MASPFINITPLYRAMQYTGSNSADIDTAASAFVDFVIVSESGGVLHATTNGSPVTANTSDWVMYSVNGISVISAVQMPNEQHCLAVCSEFADLDTRVDTLESDLGTLSTAVAGAFVRSIGVAPVPTLLLSGTATVAVQLQPAMPDSGYTAYASKFAGVSLTDLQINSVTVVDADTVNVAVENVGLATIIGASVMVHAID